MQILDEGGQRSIQDLKPIRGAFGDPVRGIKARHVPVLPFLFREDMARGAFRIIAVRAGV